MIIAIGTERAPKVAAVETAFEKAAHLFPINAQDFKFLPLTVETGISEMPLSVVELMKGASNRAENAWIAATNLRKTPSFALGLEGGFFPVAGVLESDEWFLQSWACIRDEKAVHFGSSGAISIPRPIVDEVVKDGQELGKIIDKYSKTVDVRSKGGAYDVFSRGLLNRQQSFEIAVTCALTPFINPKLYR